jgi:hypothetical protein
LLHERPIEQPWQQLDIGGQQQITVSAVMSRTRWVTKS